MTKLSDRLAVIASNINNGESMADIGTDHGYLPLYLYDQGISPKVVLADISKESLNKAISNYQKTLEYYQKALEEFKSDRWKDTSGKVSFRAGDGIKILENAEVDVVVIAGMGGILMCDILSEDLKKAQSFKRLVLQPRNHVETLRKWLVSNGFTISKEALVEEGDYICEIITAVPKKCDYKPEKTIDGVIEWQYPETLLKLKSELLSAYLKRAIVKEKNILKANLRSQPSEEKDKNIKRLSGRINYLEDLYAKANEV